MQNKFIELYKVLSILGYGLVPVVILSVVNVFMTLKYYYLSV